MKNLKFILVFMLVFGFAQTNFAQQSLFTEGQIADYREGFDLFAKDGQLTSYEFCTYMRAMGTSLLEVECQSIIEQADKDGSGTLNFEEFLYKMSQDLKPVNTEEEMMESFKVMDKDGNLFITADEIIIMTMVSPEEAEQMIKDVDTNNDGKIDYTEFKKMQ